MEESEAEFESGTEESDEDEEDDDGDLISDDSGAGAAPTPRHQDTADSFRQVPPDSSSFRHGALPEDGAPPGVFGLDASSGEGLPREVKAAVVLEDEDMEDADDVPQFLPEPLRPPGIRPPYRGLSITIPPDYELEAGFGGHGPAAAVCSPGLTIHIWKVRTAVALVESSAATLFQLCTGPKANV